MSLSEVVLLSLLIYTNLQLSDAGGGGSGWNYKTGDPKGRSKWASTNPDCGGTMQSPININTSRVLYDPNLQPFDYSGYTNTTGVKAMLENLGGRTVEVVFSGTKFQIRGGNLPATYVLEQFHFHWGKTNSRGSEHSIDGKFYPLEIHFVNRQENIPDMTAAAAHPFGLCVIAILFEIGDENPEYETLLQYFDKITNPNDEVEMEAFPVINLFPKSREHFFRYYGSLTTPPCSESVIWTVLVERNVISERQMQKFRDLFDENHQPLVDDFRQTQALNQRTILTNRRRGDI